VVLEVCAQANGATNASAMLSIVFFTFILPFGFPLNATVRRLLLAREGGVRSTFTSNQTGLPAPLFEMIAAILAEKLLSGAALSGELLQSGTRRPNATKGRFPGMVCLACRNRPVAPSAETLAVSQAD